MRWLAAARRWRLGQGQGREGNELRKWCINAVNLLGREGRAQADSLDCHVNHREPSVTDALG